jgi:hypothetical protein
MSEIIVSLHGTKADSRDIRDALGDLPYDEVEAHGMTGMEHEIAWLVGAVLGSPVAVKLLDLLEKTNAARKIKKVSITRDGKVVIEGAMPADAARLIRAISQGDGAA